MGHQGSANPSEDRVVLNRVVGDLVTAARRRGVDVRPLLVGLSFTEAEVFAEPRGRSSWDDFALLLDRVEDALGGPAVLEDVAASFIADLRPVRILASLVVGSEALYGLGARVSRYVYRNLLGMRVEAGSEGRIRIEARIPEGRRDSSGFFHASLGMFRAYPRLVGRPDAVVEAVHQGRRHLYSVAPPSWETAVGRAADRLLLPLVELLRSRPDAGEATAAELLDAIEIGYGDELYRDAARAIGERLLVAGSVPALAEALCGVLEDRLCCRSYVVWVRRNGSGPEPLARRGRGRGTASRRLSLPLAVAGREVGRLEVDLAPPLPEDARRLLDALVPWVAAAVDVQLNMRGGPRLSLDGLPPRMAELARQLCAGASEKQIAAALGLSYQSVRTYVKRLYRRLGVRSRAELFAGLVAAS